MADQPERPPQVRDTGARVVAEGSPSGPPRTFARDIDCDGGGAGASAHGAREESAARGERMPSRFGEENGRRRR